MAGQTVNPGVRQVHRQAGLDEKKTSLDRTADKQADQEAGRQVWSPGRQAGWLVGRRERDVSS